MIYSFLILPGLVAVYVMFLRHILSGVPALSKFYAEANGFWAKAWALCGKSITMGWSYFLMAIGALLNNLDGIATTMGDPHFKQQVADFLHSDPVYLGYFAMAVSGVTIAARLRSIVKPAG